MKQKTGRSHENKTGGHVINNCGNGGVISLRRGREAASGNQKNVKNITVGTGTQFPNICFIDDKGKLTGYDVELVKELDRRLPDYRFTFKTMDFSNLLVSLGQHKVDIVAHQMEKSAEREKKFLFNQVAYNNFPLKITVLQDNGDIHGINDLKGKRVITSPTSNGALVLKNGMKNTAVRLKSPMPAKVQTMRPIS